MHAVIVMRSGDYYRFVEGIAQEIVQRGGQVTLVMPEPEALAQALGARLPPGVSLAAAQPNRHWSARLLRATR
jgi:hypothetical protein